MRGFLRGLGGIDRRRTLGERGRTSGVAPVHFPTTMDGPSGVAIAAALLGATLAGGGRDRGDEGAHASASSRRRHALRTELDRQQRSSAETRAVQDLILSSMQDGVLLVDPKGATAFANVALERHLGRRPASIGAVVPDLAARRRRAGRARPRPARSWSRSASPPGSCGSSPRPPVTTVPSSSWYATSPRRAGSTRSSRDFVANASHELKTPAASIQAAAETLRQAAADDPAAVSHFAAQIEREAARLSRHRRGPPRPVAVWNPAASCPSGSRSTRSSARKRSGLTTWRGRRGLSLEVRTGDDVWVDGSARDLSLPDQEPRRQRDPVHASGRLGDRRASAREGADAVLTVTDTGSGSRRRTSHACSNASTGWTAPAPARRAGRASASRS